MRRREPPAHILTEWAREHGKDCSEWIGSVIEFPHQDDPDEIWQFTVDNEMADSAQQFVDYVYGLPHDVAFIEKLVHFDDWVPEGFGTADDVRIHFETATAYVTDFKHGKGVAVTAPGNMQLWLYALGVLATYGLIYDIQTVKIAIMQPRNGGLSEDEISAQDLLQWANEELIHVAKLAADPEHGEFVPGSHCRFCAGRWHCREVDLS